MKIFYTIFLALLTISNIFSQTTNPKREFRSAWIATVENLDWPTTRGNTAEQKQQLITLLDALQKANINVIIFQIRTECDALYASPYEPWSYYVTGYQGVAPSPFYDPLQFAVEEAHKRGMEIHAWFNPYRAVKSVGQYTIANNHVTKTHPEWVLNFGSLKILDPGLPQVRDFVVKIVADVVTRYDIDGVHMDDYFYPYSGITTQDSASWRLYKGSFTDIGDWRRDNVNTLIDRMHDTIQVIRPSVKVGMSPFGIWKNGVPPGIIGLSGYNDIYADAINWLNRGNIDYLTPQLYWKIGGNQDYIKLSRWWADSTAKYNSHFYPGMAPYHISDAQNWSATEFLNQMRENRSNPKTKGQVFFRAAYIPSNPKGLTDSLKNGLFKTVALLPQMSWKDNVAPNAPQNLIFARIPGTGVSGLQWDKPSTAADGDTSKFYVIYNFNSSNIQQTDLDNPANILTSTDQKNFNPLNNPKTSYVVTALDDNHNESIMSNILTITVPQVPILAMPVNNDLFQSDTTNLKWNYAANSSKYQLQVASDAGFTNLVLNNVNVLDTTFNFVSTEGQKQYYWRVKSINAAGESVYSNAFTFKTAFPTVPVLVSPVHASLNQELNVELVWKKEVNSVDYQLQVAKTQGFLPASMLLDTIVVDTTYSLVNLLQNQYYFWRVKGNNQYGSSGWSNAFGFKTKSLVFVESLNGLPKDYDLAQNYPNPFNPTTTISFAIPESGFASLKIYDVLGNEVGNLINENLSPGKYEVQFDGANLSSGIYIYKLVVNGKAFMKKMLLMK